MLMEALKLAWSGQQCARRELTTKSAYRSTTSTAPGRTIQDEKHYDKLDRALRIQGCGSGRRLHQGSPLDCAQNLELELSPEDKAKIENGLGQADGNAEKKRFEEQGTPRDGSKLATGRHLALWRQLRFNPQGIHIDQGKSRNKVR
jgi:hypothetical protein